MQNLKATGFRFVFCLVFGRDTHDALLTEAHLHEVAGTGVHNWLFADSFANTLDQRSFEEGSPLHLAYRGAAVLEVSGGVAGVVPSYDTFEAQMRELVVIELIPIMS